MKWLHHLNIMRKSRKHGSLFPQHHHQPNPAPNGSSEIPVYGGLLTNIFGYKRFRYEVEWFRHSEHHIDLPKWPQNVHILHLSDIHIRDFSDWLKKLATEIQGYTPDIVVITGDIVTKNWTLEAVEFFLSQLPKSKLGTFAILGNWEYWVVKDHQYWRQLLSKYHVQLLVEEGCEVALPNASLTIFGTDDHLAGTSQPNLWGPSLSPNQPSLVLTHSPAHFREIAKWSTDLVLAGHAHGGQIQFPLLGPLWVPTGTDQWIAGWHQLQNSHLFVSRGLGWSVAPIRWHCPPEIAHIWINSSQSNSSRFQ